jgi:hypothetical protein
VSRNSSIARNRGLPTAGHEVFRLTTPVALWWVWVVFAAANVVDLAVQGSPAHSALVIDAIVLLVTGLAYALALRPRVIADQAGITIVNPFRDHHVPWAVIQGVDAGDWVRVHHTTDGSPATAVEVPGKAIECWALYVSARTKRRAARGTPPARSRAGGFRGFGPPPVDEMARLPAEAKYLASLPVAKAIATRLDALAAKERARAGQADPGQADPRQADPRQADPRQADPRQADTVRAGSGQPGWPGPVISRWAWFPFTAVAVPALALLITVLV